jgi:hypothetical protein
MRGYIMRDVYGKGTKSERDAVFIKTDDARYILRRKTGPVFDDDELVQYIGHDAKCEGFLVGTTFLAELIEVID